MAQQSLVTSLISRGVTCDADNLVDYQSDSTSTHTNCLIQLLKNSRLSLSPQPRPRILQQPFYLSSCFSNLFPEKLLSTQPLAPSIRTSSLQREAHSTAFKTAVNHLFSTAFDPFDRTTNRIKPPPCRPTRILHIRSSFASPSFNLTY